MRIICPNCDAQYEVDAQVIPESGRDLQCSSCGHTWFQYPASAILPEAAPADDIVAQDFIADDVMPDDAVADDAVADDATPENVMADGIAPDDTLDDAASALPDDPFLEFPDDIPEPADDIAPAPQPEVIAAPAARRAIDEDVLNILRQEAAHEEAARRKDAARESLPEPAPETESAPDPDPAVEEETTRPRRVRRADGAPAARPAEPITPELAEGLAAAAPVATRRELLPDIEEINSTLRATDPPATTTPVNEAPRKQLGFGFGFGVVVLVFLVAMLVYLTAPALALSAPVLEPALQVYVGAINALRDWLDASMQRTATRLSELLAQFDAPQG